MNAEEKRSEIIHRMKKALANAEQESVKPLQKPSKPEAARTQIPEPIAIIGLSGFFPKCMSVSAFWDALDKDEVLVEEIPSGRIKSPAHSKDNNGTSTRWGGLIPDIYGFDPAFFGVLPSEAATLDPRKRLLMMSAYHTIEDSGYTAARLRKKGVGVFVAIEEDEYSQCLKEAGHGYSPAGNSSSLIANQLSYFFDFHGPSEIVNTMCSGAAVAIHRAVCSLRSGEVSYALIGGANLLLHDDPFEVLSQTGQMSPDHTVRSFGKNAKGFLRAEGVATILLKRLTDAREDHDAIYAVIKNTAINFNGRGGLSMASPNISSHVDVIRSCYEQVGVQPQQVAYIEAQGMGNPLADVAEWEAFNKALKGMAAKDSAPLGNGLCRVSTLKPMTGHMHSASALGALFKIIRSFETNSLHKIIGLDEISPDLDLVDQPCRLLTDTEHWPRENYPRMAGLHSYGSGGNNAHILLEEYKDNVAGTDLSNDPQYCIIPLSARTEKQRRALVQELINTVRRRTDYDISSIAYTLQTGRQDMACRVAFVAKSREELIEQAEAFLATGEVKLNAGALNIDTDSVSQAAAWMRGENMVWENAIPNGVSRLHLPLYPFDCQRYSMAEKEPASTTPGEMPACQKCGKTGRTCSDKNRNCGIHRVRKQADPERNSASARAEQIVRNVLGHYLRLPEQEVGLDQDFSTLGFDSLMVVSLARKLRESHGLMIEPAQLFGQTTPRLLITFLTDTFYDQLVHTTSDTSSDRKDKHPVEVFEENESVRHNAAGGANDLIAIIGLAGSFPQSPGLDTYWRNIIEGKSCIEEVPADRWDVAQHFHPDKETAKESGRSYGKWGGFLKDLNYFDPLFFNISPSEAENMNPKERIFLQCSWHVMEDAGYTPQSLAGEKVGVFVGVTRSGLDPYKVSMFPVANRVSYTFNFRGPSIPVDTACSSSLVAITQACQYIQTGECTVAIAGGVHAFLDASHFAALSSLQMLSPDGVTRSFGENANGMVPGEGVGAVLLKPMARALADGDHIYGVIRAASTNHGGKSNGFTVPNPKAHAELIRDTLHKANLNARQINYVEAHGTGTSLGDPIEILGLSEAFRSDTSDLQYCPVGSVKSNIGHLEAAAGISALAKVLLQMKFKKLAPSLNSQLPNENIDFARTPFYVQQESVDWVPVDTDGNEIPRIACVSSFGAGGSNAHVIIEEYNVTVTRKREGQAIIVLSAKSDSQLQRQIRQLLTYATTQREEGLLHDIAYTLQTGREPMEKRVGFIVDSIRDLEDKLRLLDEGRHTGGLFHFGNSRKNNDTFSWITNDPGFDHLLQNWFTTRNYKQLLDLWIRGFALNWDQLYDQPAGLPNRISLPVYPFQKEFYPVAHVTEQYRQHTSEGKAKIHPLLHENLSTFFEQKFISTFTGEEFFLNDHVVNGRKTLPAVAYLEMVCAAMKYAMPDSNNSTLYLKNVGWIQPFIAGDQATRLYTRLDPGQEGMVDYEIFTEEQNGDATDRIVHGQGSSCFLDVGDRIPPLDISVLKETFGSKHIPASQCYAEFKKLGIAYGPSHQAISQLFVGDTRALARLFIPTVVADTVIDYTLHPAMIDAATQVIMGLMIFRQRESDEELPLAVPFALDELTVFDRCSGDMWAYVQAATVNSEDDINNLSFDITLCQTDGTICLNMKGFMSRVIRQGTQRSGQILFLRPSWNICPLSHNGAVIEYDEQVVLYPEATLQEFQHEGIRFIPLKGKPVNNDITDLVLQVFQETQKLLSTVSGRRILLQVLVPQGYGWETFRAVSGLLKSAHRENPRFFGQVITLQDGMSSSDIITRLNDNRQYPEDQDISYTDGERTVLQLAEYEPGKETPALPWKDKGVYLITGGVGGIGILFAREIIANTKDAVIILAGRSDLNDARKQQIDNLIAVGTTVQFRKAEVTEMSQTEVLVDNIIKEFGQINGILHCAGVLRDNFILKKTEEEVRTVLAPKVKGTVCLDEATKHLPLDFFVLFSSVGGVMGNSGQSDYAVANNFMDEYARYRNRLVTNGERSGKAISINWPLWEQGGMRVDKEIETMMLENFGMASLKTTNGLYAFYAILNSGFDQLMALEGNRRLLQKTFLPYLFRKADSPKETDSSSKQNKSRELSDPSLKDKATDYFKKLLSGVIKLSPERIDADVAMEEYGIDSIMVMKLTNELEKVFGSLPKTLFFEYHNIGELTGYFLEAYAEKISQLLGGGKTGDVGVRPETHDPVSVKSHGGKKVIPLGDRKTDWRRALSPTVNKEKVSDLEIAIIGLAGSYPQARNLEDFWENLCHGKNCVTEIPVERWDHTLYFHADKNKIGKTYSKWGGFLEGVDEFDSSFFNISPREAEILDPQERLFLQCVYATLEDAGYTRETLGHYNSAGLNGNVGVYVGVMWEEYQLYGAQETALGNPMVLSSSPSSIANRVSYYFNFHGPSIAVDTMCSSSLTSIHLACQSLNQGECDVAIAGGVNVSVHPNKYLVLGHGRFASSKGLCESFGEGGDGYVPGEGVGAVLLKPLSKAIADHDHIYGVIKGTAVNHGGKTNGFTVPNPAAQSNAIANALKMARFEPRTVSYIEAHGTGTSLGDPIEVSGLSRIFGTGEKQYCRIGSVKSNIGHCESAAGISGVTKVLLQLKHRQLVPSIHSQTLNPNIDLENSPFRVQQELTTWDRPVVKDREGRKEFPRRAGISSFGAGGSNSHILIEEFSPSAGNRDVDVQESLFANSLIVLSARTEERLHEQAKQLLSAIRKEGFTDADVRNLAYTLQVGREAMEERLAMEVSGVHDLTDKLTRLARNERDIEGLFSGRANTHKELLSFFSSDDDMEKTIESWIKRKKYNKLLKLWVSGFNIDWEKLYSDPSWPHPKRISLPTYPFLRTRHWPELKANNRSVESSNLARVLHPLVQENISTFQEQKFSAVFNGQEFFLKDHVVHGEKLLPGVAYIEMVHQALRIAGNPDAGAIRIDNLVWAMPFQIKDDAQRINIVLSPGDAGEIGFEVTSTTTDTESPVVYSYGVAQFIEPEAKADVLDVKEISAREGIRIFSAQKCYQQFERRGLGYGPAMRSIEQIYLDGNQLLAALTLPDGIADSADKYYLHPSLFDAALQSLIGFTLPSGAGDQMDLAVPFAVTSIEILGRCTRSMWALVRRGNAESFDIDLANDVGKVCVRLRGYTVRVIQENRSSFGQDILLIKPEWQREEVRRAPAETFNRRIAVILDNEVLADSIRTRLPSATVRGFSASGTTAAQHFESHALEIFRVGKSLLTSALKEKTLIQVIITTDEEREHLFGLSGLVRTITLENPLVKGQIISVPAGDNVDRVLRMMEENESSFDDAVIRYVGTERSVFRLTEYPGIIANEQLTWKEDGVYLITGGAGGLGQVFSREIVRQARRISIILAGRSALNEEIEQQLSGLRSSTVTIEYRQVDVSDAGSVHALIELIKEKYGMLHGIIHTAGLLRDSLIAKKTDEDVRAVFAPKVQGISNLDLATKDLPLDFFILCSSTASLTGNVGQGDYAMANGFMDWFARLRNARVQRKERSGKTTSINWPLWKEGGMHITKEQEEILYHSLGITALDTSPALNALNVALSAELDQLMVLQGNLKKLRATFLAQAPVRDTIPKPEKTTTGINVNDAGTSSVSTYLTGLLSATLKLPAHQINVDKPMEEYGIDSVMVMRMTYALEKVFGSLSKTLFFEYHTLRELATYFEESHAEKLKGLLGVNDPSSTPEVTGNNDRIAGKENMDVKRLSHRFKSADAQKQTKKDNGCEIAIVGVAGSYPQARDLTEFWKVLREGRNCITEIPGDRWDHSRYFDVEKNKNGKTYSRWGGFMDGVDTFDPLFFGITPKEAATMDPQERLFLQCAYETFEDAGYTRESLGAARNIGVYVGVMTEEYQLFGPEETALGRPLVLSGNSAAIANRVSYYFNLQGPSITLNTMCSSSLTTIHLACQSLLLGECEAAIAGGVNVTVHPNKYLALSYGNFLSTRGLCETFGAGGDGYVPGEGVGAVLLKPLAKAIEDRDHIYGVIKGTAVNHGGKTNGYTVPNPKAQATVIHKAMEMAGFTARSISYIEAHGTGTSLGDPIEINGLKRAFDSKEKQYCAIGSVKSNIGHCESAAGIAGITKVLLQLKFGKLVPSIHTETLNPNIDFEDSPFIVQRQLADWKNTHDEFGNPVPRRAGVSGFGAGGSNAHVLIEEYLPSQSLPDRNSPSLKDQPAIVVLSARSFDQLKVKAQRLTTWIREAEYGSGKLLYDIAYTLQVGREAMEERLALVVATRDELEEKLEEFIRTGRVAGKDFCGRVREGTNTFKEIISVDPSASTGYSEWLERWVNGVTFDWNSLYKNRDARMLPRRISLPTHPFDKRRCWFSEPPVQPVNDPLSGISVMLRKQWYPAPIDPDQSPQRAVVLYSPDTVDLARHLSKALPGSILIDADAPMELQVEAWERNDPYTKLPGLIDVTGCGNSSRSSMEWIKLLQFLITKGSRPVSLLCATVGLTSFENEHINLAGAVRSGVYKVLGSEYRYVVSRHLDLDIGSSVALKVAQIVKEYSSHQDAPEVCYRNGQRYTPLLATVTEGNGNLKPLHFRESDVLWITGGTRGLGLMCAFHFVKKYGARKLVLLGQEQIPSRDQWDQVLEKDSSTAQKIRNIKSLESLGVEVKALSTLLTDKDNLFNAVQETRRWGTIRGVVHCAGAGDNNNPAFIKKSLHELQKVMDPKIKGLNNLYDCVHTEPLLFFLLFSSVSGVIPTLGVGQSAYAMSNSYMDHFAEAKSKECPIISIQWPSWRDTGMGEAKTKAYDQTGLKSLSDTEGLLLLDRVLEQRISPVVLPCIINPEAWHPQELLKHEPVWRKSNEVPPDNIPATPGQPDDSEKLTIEILEWLKDLFCKELKLEPSDLKVDKPFQDYGIDSIMIAQLLLPIRKKILQDIDPSILYEYTSITTFTGWLVKNHQPVLSKIFLVEEPGKVEEIPEKERIPAGSHNSPIAVVGMACRFPGATDLNAYWNLLLSGNSAIQAVPGERWKSAGNDFAGLIDNPFSFDPQFFLLHEEDVKAMDPQALVVLEETMKLFHHAGYTPDEIKGKMAGVYIGGRSGHSVEADTLRAVRNPVMVVGQNYLSANISQFFDLRGPSMTIDTACSSALVGMNAAIRALQHGEIECAVVGGVNILGSDKTHELFRQRGILKEDEDFHLFDQRAKGIIPGEGVGMVLLKTLEQARIDGDFVYATIRSVAINNDGRTAGPATPNIEAQRQVMQSALSAAGKNPEDIQYIEVNGSGSLVTDLIELKTINAVYGSRDRAVCGLGSIKPNIGHPLCAEGIASFIKVVLMLHHKRFVPFLSGQLPPPYVDLASSRFEFCRTADEWNQGLRTAAINCFADGGTNAHVILESYDPAEQVHIARRPIDPPSLNRKNFRSQKEITTVESMVLEHATTFQNSVPDSIWERFN